MPAEGFGYYLNDDEKEEAARKSWEQYALDRQNQRFIRKITALVSSVLLAQEKGYLNYNDGNKSNEENGREGEIQNQSKSSSSALTQVS